MGRAFGPGAADMHGRKNRSQRSVAKIGLGLQYGIQPWSELKISLWVSVFQHIRDLSVMES